MYRDEATASSVLRSLRAKIEREGGLHDNRLTRTGRVVVSYFGLRGYQLPAHLARAMTAPGPPDVMWTSADPPVAVVRAEVAARRVPVTVTNKTPRVLLGHDEASLRTMAAVVDDDAVRERIPAVDPASHTALMMLGIASVDVVPEVALHDRVERTELFITTVGATPMIATMLITDRLPQIPAMAQLLEPGLGWRVTCTPSGD